MRTVGRLNLIAFVVLLAVVVILGNRYFEKRNELSIAQKELEYDSIVAAHIDFAERMNDYRSLNRFFLQTVCISDSGPRREFFSSDTDA